MGSNLTFQLSQFLRQLLSSPQDLPSNSMPPKLLHFLHSSKETSDGSQSDKEVT